jgi:hypothetical protein
MDVNHETNPSACVERICLHTNSFSRLGCQGTTAFNDNGLRGTQA